MIPVYRLPSRHPFRPPQNSLVLAAGCCLLFAAVQVWEGRYEQSLWWLVNLYAVTRYGL